MFCDASGRGSSRCCPRTWGGAVIRSGTTVGWSRGSSTATGPGCRGGTCRARSSGRGRRCGSGTAGTPGTAPGTGCWRGAGRGRRGGKVDWRVSVDATITRAHQHATNTRRPEQDTGGTVELQESAGPVSCEPAGHGVGRSRGGLTTKIQRRSTARADRWRWWSPAGSATTAPCWSRSWPTSASRAWAGAPTHPTGRGDRGQGLLDRRDPRELARRGIKAVIPEKSDEIAARRRRGCAGGRPPGFDAET